MDTQSGIGQFCGRFLILGWCRDMAGKRHLHAGQYRNIAGATDIFACCNDEALHELKLIPLTHSFLLRLDLGLKPCHNGALRALAVLHRGAGKARVVTSERFARFRQGWVRNNYYSEKL